MPLKLKGPRANTDYTWASGTMPRCSHGSSGLPLTTLSSAAPVASWLRNRDERSPAQPSLLPAALSPCPGCSPLPVSRAVRPALLISQTAHDLQIRVHWCRDPRFLLIFWGLLFLLLSAITDPFPGSSQHSQAELVAWARSPSTHLMLVMQPVGLRQWRWHLSAHPRAPTGIPSH